MAVSAIFFNVASGAVFPAAAVAWQGLVLSLAVSAAVGAGYSLLFVGGLGLINRTVPEGERGAASMALLSGLTILRLLAPSRRVAGLSRSEAG